MTNDILNSLVRDYERTKFNAELDFERAMELRDMMLELQGEV